ncbi:MAG: response regulator [Pirellulales bacterium]
MPAIYPLLNLAGTLSAIFVVQLIVCSAGATVISRIRRLQHQRVLEKVRVEIASREQAVEALRQTEEKYRSIFENAVEGIFQTSLDGHYVSANPALARIYGYDSPDALRSGVCDIQHQLYVDPQRREQFQRLMLRDGAVIAFESQVYRRDGSVIWISENAHVVCDAQGRPLYYEGTVTDITDHVQSDSLRREKEAAEAACHAKSQFLANMSHEIRTPLNGVIGMLDLLAGTDLSAKQQRYAQIAKSSADSLLSLINQILDFSKIEAGKLELDIADFDLRTVMEDTVEMFAGRAQQKSIELACQISPDVPTSLRGDPDRFRQIVINLVNNAIKFTEQGEVVVRATLDRQSEEQTVVRLAVSDTGIGIPPERHGRLFHSFSQVDVSTTRKYGGTGLGLAITKTLVELMGGQIGFESRPGHGSTFWCTLSFGRQSAEQRDVCRIPQELRRLRVLALDDNATNLEILREQFTSWGLSLTTVSEGVQALETLRQAAAAGRPYDLAILDVQMPDMDGFQVAQAVRADAVIRDIVLLVFTSMGQDLDEMDLAALSLSGYIHKPVRQSRLLDAIVNATSQALVVRSQLPAACAPAKDAQTQRGARVLVAEDNEVNQIVVSEILARAGIECRVVGNGRTAADLATREHFELVLMDCQMPDMDGFEAARHIRTHESASPFDAPRRRVPIVALTANAIKGDRERCLAAGMDGYLTKPIEPTTLVETVRSYLEGRQHAAEQNGHAVSAAVAPGSAPEAAATIGDETAVIDAVQLCGRCLGDLDFIQSLLSKFTAIGGDELEKLDRSIAASDRAELARTAHRLRGMAANLSVDRVAALAAKLEADAAAAPLEQLSDSLVRLHQEFARARQTIPGVFAELSGERSRG